LARSFSAFRPINGPRGNLRDGIWCDGDRGFWNRDSDASTALEICRAITEWLDLAYALGTLLFPIRLRGALYARFMDASEALEAAILDWTARWGDADPQRDLLSRFVNGPDEAGLGHQHAD